MTTTLYRTFDDRGRLLYVGVSFGPFLRLEQHEKNASWTRYVATITLERYGSREEAEAAEKRAIQEEDPVFNRYWRPRERYLRWIIAYPDGDPDSVDLDNLSPEAHQEVVIAMAWM